MMKKKDEFLQFAEWVALPSPLREPQTQEEWAKEQGIKPGTLSAWKQKPEFWEVVAGQRKLWCRDKTSDVIAGLFRTASRGMAAEVKLWLQLVEEWSEKEAPSAPQITLVGIKGLTEEAMRTLMPAKEETKKEAIEGEVIK